MNRFSAALLTVAALSVASPAWAGSDLPEPTHGRLILRGVDCSIEAGVICAEERPVFDEAIAGLPNTAIVVIRRQVLDGRSGEPERSLPPVSADAVRDYFVGAGLAPEQVEIEGRTETPELVDWQVPIDVQLSETAR